MAVMITMAHPITVFCSLHTAHQSRLISAGLQPGARHRAFLLESFLVASLRLGHPFRTEVDRGPKIVYATQKWSSFGAISTIFLPRDGLFLISASRSRPQLFDRSEQARKIVQIEMHNATRGVWLSMIC